VTPTSPGCPRFERSNSRSVSLHSSPPEATDNQFLV
jgi:hypothetical protein